MPTVKVKGNFAVDDMPIVNMIVVECFLAIMFFTCRAAGVFLAWVIFGLIWFIVTVFIWLKANFCITGVVVTKHYLVVKHGNEIRRQIPISEIRSVEVGKHNKVTVNGSKNYKIGKMPEAYSFERMMKRMMDRAK